MLRHPGKTAAIFGLALIALSLTGSTRNGATSQPAASRDTPSLLLKEAQALYGSYHYAQARAVFLSYAREAESARAGHQAAIGWSSAGAVSIVLLQYRDALSSFLRARKIAEQNHDVDALSRTFVNLSTLYLNMGNYGSALSVARDGLTLQLPEAGNGAVIRAKLRENEAQALAHLGRFDEAAPTFRQAISVLEDSEERTEAARSLGLFGTVCIDANHLEEAEEVLSRALALVRIHHLNNGANILRALGKLKALQGDTRSATALFDEALRTPPGTTQQWLIYADRGDFRLSTGDYQGALSDFREARRVASQMRADVVPADQDRVALESGLNRIAGGYLEAGNHIALQSNNLALLDETFSVAEQDRLWSLRALIPEPNDWRTRLPPAYWDVLARYQSVERGRIGKPSTAPDDNGAGLEQQLEQMEAFAAGNDPASRALRPDAEGSELRHVRAVLDADSVLFSFHINKSGGWLWAADRGGVAVYRLADVDSLKSDAAALTLAIQHGDGAARGLGQRLYRNLFGGVAPSYLAHPRWLLELDGPLFDVPFAALLAGEGSQEHETGKDPEYLGERVALETIPSALMLQPREAFRPGEMLGIGDPVYNAADPRYALDGKQPDIALTRLPATAAELNACTRQWGPKARVLIGEHASVNEVESALETAPSVVHFATHVIRGSGEHASGLIALSLNPGGSLGLIGPTEIAARSVHSELVVLNGCHSAQGDALPGTGLMGLTRAWIAAGAKSVLATRWDIPDDAARNMMVAFYRFLKSNPSQGPAFALRQSQLEMARTAGYPPSVWAAYFLLARQ